MSYTITNKFGDVFHSYKPPRDGPGSYIPGAWWPDFGPMSFDYSEQYKMHPTNTIFRNRLQVPKDRQNLLESSAMTPVASPMAGRSMSAPSETSSAPETPKQFRRQPHTEALYKSTIIQPYKSGGGRNAGKERTAYQFSATKEAPVLRESLEQFRTIQQSNSMPSLTIGSSPGSPCSAATSTRIFAGSGRSMAGEGETPSFVASSTVISRPVDAAGFCGSSRFRHHDRHSVPGQMSPVSSSLNSSAVLSRSGTLNAGSMNAMSFMERARRAA
mmetsp:Transcript_5186/g.13354  ORF Transcript_5186/g.13354 Transcript_5186/m.13354 type:complete len:272 (+) Transcript_5186:97-912(+)